MAQISGIGVSLQVGPHKSTNVPFVRGSDIYSHGASLWDDSLRAPFVYVPHHAHKIQWWWQYGYQSHFEDMEKLLNVSHSWWTYVCCNTRARREVR